VGQSKVCLLKSWHFICRLISGWRVCSQRANVKGKSEIKVSLGTKTMTRSQMPTFFAHKFFSCPNICPAIYTKKLLQAFVISKNIYNLNYSQMNIVNTVNGMFSKVLPILKIYF